MLITCTDISVFSVGVILIYGWCLNYSLACRYLIEDYVIGGKYPEALRRECMGVVSDLML